MVSPKYYYNLSGNITDGEKEYSLHHKEDKIGGLSVSGRLNVNLLNKFEDREFKRFVNGGW